MKHTQRVSVRSKDPPVIEIDPSCLAAYVRYKKGKVAKTKEITQRRSPVTCTVDFDANGEVVGIELIGVKEFTLEKILELLPEGARNFDFRRARFVPAASVPASA